MTVKTATIKRHLNHLTLDVVDSFYFTDSPQVRIHRIRARLEPTSWTPPGVVASLNVRVMTNLAAVKMSWTHHGQKWIQNQSATNPRCVQQHWPLLQFSKESQVEKGRASKRGGFHCFFTICGPVPDHGLLNENCGFRALLTKFPHWQWTPTAFHIPLLKSHCKFSGSQE